MEGLGMVLCESGSLVLPFCDGRVPAGFPSPAEDYVECQLDLNDYLIAISGDLPHARGRDSMKGAGLFNGDLILQLIVQLLKRWRDLFYSRSKFAADLSCPNYLGGKLVQGGTLYGRGPAERSRGIVQCLDVAHARGEHLKVLNPVHYDEDFSERWSNRDEAYKHFDSGIRHFAKRWREIYMHEDDPKKAFIDLLEGLLEQS